MTERGFGTENKPLRYFLMPSLVQMSAVKVTTTFWSQKAILDEINKFKLNGKYWRSPEDWGDIENLISIKVNKLTFLPKAVTDILLETIHPIGSQIYQWMVFHDKMDKSNVLNNGRSIMAEYFGCLVWESRGRIDYEKTARMLTNQDGISNFLKYKIACLYCLEDTIVVLARNLEIARFLAWSNIARDPMVFWWTSYITRDTSRIDAELLRFNIRNQTNYRVDEYVFHLLIEDECRILFEAAYYKKPNLMLIAVKFMWDRLSDMEKAGITDLAFLDSDIACFLLSQMSEEQQRKIFNGGNVAIFSRLLQDWLWRDYVLPTANRIWNVDADVKTVMQYYIKVLREVSNTIRKCTNGSIRYRYQNILKEIWFMAPGYLKQLIIQEENFYGFLVGVIFELLDGQNVDLIKFILSDFHKRELRQRILSDRGLNIFLRINGDEMESLQFLITLMLSEENDIAHYKSGFINQYGYSAIGRFLAAKKWDEITKFFNFCFDTDEERNIFKRALTSDRENYFGVLKGLVSCNVMNHTVSEGYLKSDFFLSNDVDRFQIVNCDNLHGMAVNFISIADNDYENVVKCLPTTEKKLKNEFNETANFIMLIIFLTGKNYEKTSILNYLAEKVIIPSENFITISFSSRVEMNLYEQRLRESRNFGGGRTLKIKKRMLRNFFKTVRDEQYKRVSFKISCSLFSPLSDCNRFFEIFNVGVDTVIEMASVVKEHYVDQMGLFKNPILNMLENYIKEYENNG